MAGSVAALGIYALMSPSDRLLEVKVQSAVARVPLRILFGSLVSGSTLQWHAWELRQWARVLARHGLPRPVGLAGRAGELLACVATAGVFGVTFLSVAGKRRLAARCRDAVSPRSLRRLALAAASRIVLALLYRGLLRLAGARARASVSEALFDCLLATLTEQVLDTGYFAALPPYLTFGLLVDFNDPVAETFPGRGGRRSIWEAFDDFFQAFVGDAITTACFGCYALPGPDQAVRRAGIFLAHAAASISAAWSVARLDDALETTKPRICDADA